MKREGSINLILVSGFKVFITIFHITVVNLYYEFVMKKWKKKINT